MFAWLYKLTMNHGCSCEHHEVSLDGKGTGMTTTKTTVCALHLTFVEAHKRVQQA